MVEVLGGGTIVAALKHEGTTVWTSEVLKMSVHTGVSWTAHSFISLTPYPNPHRGMLSGPAASRALTFLRPPELCWCPGCLSTCTASHLLTLFFVMCSVDDLFSFFLSFWCHLKSVSVTIAGVWV